MQASIVGGDVSVLKAREAFIAYRNLVKEGRATEDDGLPVRSYKAIAQGKRVLDLRETLRIGGLDAQFRPRLAIARADLPEVVFTHVTRFDRWCYSHRRWPNVRSASSGKVLPVPAGIYPALDGRSCLPVIPGSPQYQSSMTAAVPPVPAEFRPVGSLAPFHILWEAEWRPVAPRDPILLKRIGGYLYAVLAQWDLTELERAVLGARLS